MSQSDTWRWADEKGEQRLVEAEELRSAIANGVLPPTTLVWREGMTAWVPAISLAEFADVAPTGDHPGTAKAEPNKAAGPGRSTLQGLHAKEVHAALAAEKRTPSVAPPRPATGGAKPATTKTLRPSTGPAVPAAPRLPSDLAGKSPGPPRPGVGTVRTAAPAPAPIAAPAPAPPPRAPATTKDWSITDDETTNVPGKEAPVQQRPEPLAETAQLQSPSASRPVPVPSRQNTARGLPSPQAILEQRQETTESTTFQFSKNTLSNLKAAKPEPVAESEKPTSNPSSSQPVVAETGPPPSLMEAYAKHPSGTRPAPIADDMPPTAPSPELPALDEDGLPAYANKTARLADYLPKPPPMRETTATTMLPDDMDESAAAAQRRRPHEVSRTIRLAADFLGKVLNPASSGRTARLDTSNNAGFLNGLMQIKPPPLPPPSAGGQQPQFVRLPSAAPNAATSLALRQVQAPPGQPPAPAQTQLPLNALLTTGALLITMVIGAFFVGRCSVKPNASNTQTAKAGIGNALHLDKLHVPPPVKPCSVSRQPARWAADASKSLPFDILALPSGKVAVGYAKDSDEAVGIEVSPATGQVEKKFTDKTNSEIERVTPTGKGFFISTTETSDTLRQVVPVAAEKPFYLGMANSSLTAAEKPDGRPSSLWSLEGDISLDSARVISTAGGGYFVSLRRKAGIFAGVLGTDHKPVGALVQVTGSGGPVGKPMSGTNGREVAISFADRAGDQGAWKIRLGHAPVGKIPQTTTMFDVPAGGPGGDAEAPAIAGLADGRWVLVWTEGSSGSRAVRAQTFGSTFTPAGAPIMVSTPSGNFGRSVVAVVGNLVTVVFLQKSKSSYELWGTVLRCE